MGCDQSKSSPPLDSAISNAHKSHVPANLPKVKAAIVDALAEDGNRLAPVLIRLAFHDAGTYSASDGIGGPNASIRFMGGAEFNTAPNASMGPAINKLNVIYDRIEGDRGSMTKADLWSYAGIVATEVLGGPKDIKFYEGRSDATLAESNQEAGRLPNPGSECPVLRQRFREYRLDARGLVALSGGHTVGVMKGIGGNAWTSDTLKFDNAYFVNMLKYQWVSDNQLVFYPKGQKSAFKKGQGLTMLKCDVALLDDPECKAIVEEYSKDQGKFFSDYADAYHKVLHTTVNQ